VIADNYGSGIGFIDVFGWPTVTGCLFSGNSGHGIDINEGSPTIHYSVFLNNAMDGIACIDSHSQITWCTFVGNRNGLFISRSDLEIDLTIIAFNNELAISCSADGEALLSCCDVYQNTSGNWIGCLAGQENGPGNFSADPCFCDLNNKDVSVCADSYCLPQNNPICTALVGALGEGCVACDCSGPVSTENMLWGDVKSMFR